MARKEESMQVVKLRRVGNSTTVTLPASVIEALHLRENDEVAVDIAGDRIIITRATTDFQVLDMHPTHLENR